ncbi:MAG: type VI secretion system membrane subunit TssM [Gemmatimonadaceae bacterium]
MLTTRQWWEVGGVVMLLTLLWSIGAWFHWSITWLLGGTVVIFVAAMMMLVVQYVRANRDAAALEHSIRGQGEDARYGVRPERREQLEQIEEEFTAAVTTLKQSKLAKGGRGKSALYALPWYVVIGPPSAGKTTAITASGLDFPLGTNRVSGFGGTRNCDWFFSTSAILLDTSGRYTTVSEDREEWFKFLDLLKKHRRRTPVNGVLAMVSIDELLNATSTELEELATDLRNRVSELTERLGVRFPVYVVLTKCDKIRGFAQYFGGLTPEERKQVWGCTFAPTIVDRAAQFDTEFAVLVQALVDRRLARLASLESDSDEAREVYLFPLEFAAVGATLKQFVSRLFKIDPYQELPDFRGFYFTSALQDGAVTNRVLDRLSERFQLGSWKDGPAGVRPTTTSTFLQSLLADLIIGDRNRVAPTSGSAMSRERLRLGAIVGLAAALIGFFWAAGSAYANSLADLGMLRGAVRSASSAATASSFDSLSSLEHALVSLDSLDVSRRLSKLGFDRTAQFRPGLESLYVRQTIPIVTTRAAGAIDSRLRAYVGSDTAMDARARAHDDLHAYQLLGNKVGFLRDSVDERVFLAGYLQHALGAQARDSAYLWRFVNVLDHPVIATDSLLVDRTQRLLYAPPTMAGLYREIRTGGARRLPPLTLHRLIGNPVRSPFERGPQVDGLYTKQGWEGFAQQAITERSQAPGRRDWVVGSRPENLDSTLADPERVAGELTRMYFDDYIAEWTRFLRAVQFTGGNVGAVTQMMSELSDAERSPVVVLLDSVTAQTRFGNPMLAAPKKKINKMLEVVLQKLGRQHVDGAGIPSNPVDVAFATVHALRGSNAAALGQVLEQYRTFGNTMLAKGAGTPNTSTADDLIQDAKTAVVNMPPSIEKLDPAIRAALLERPFAIAQKVIGDAAVGVLSREWSDQVCMPFRKTLAGKYPFALTATDASLTDVEKFFQPQTGTIWTFFDRTLAGFLSASDFQTRAGSQAGINISAAATNSFRRARAIREGLLGMGGAAHVEFELQPEAPISQTTSGQPPTPTEMCMSIDGKRECYRMGSPSGQAFVWPSKISAPGAKLTVSLKESGGRIVELSREAFGEWGWLRLLEQASVSTQPGGRTRMEWLLENPRVQVRVAYTLSVRQSQNLFNNLAIFRQFDCPSRLQ